MKKALFGFLGACALVGFMLPAVGTTPVSAKAEKAKICHYPGHENDRVITGGGLACYDEGGQVIEVAKVAACKGHGVESECD